LCAWWLRGHHDHDHEHEHEQTMPRHDHAHDTARHHDDLNVRFGLHARAGGRRDVGARDRRAVRRSPVGRGLARPGDGSRGRGLGHGVGLGIAQGFGAHLLDAEMDAPWSRRSARSSSRARCRRGSRPARLARRPREVCGGS
jgi:hypothetical protein